MRKLRWLMASLLVIGLLVSDVHLAFATCASTDIMCYVVAAVQKFRVDKSGNMSVAGTSTVTGNSTITGNLAVTGTASVTGATTLTGGVTQSTTTMTGGFNPWSRTLAQLNALLPSTTYQFMVCSDCVMTHVCISSGSNPNTSIGAWTVLQSTSPTAALTLTIPHCQ